MPSVSVSRIVKFNRSAHPDRQFVTGFATIWFTRKRASVATGSTDGRTSLRPALPVRTVKSVLVSADKTADSLMNIKD